MDTFQDLSSLALEFQVEPTVKSTSEPEVIKKRDQFKNAWQERMIWGLTVTPRLIEWKNCVLPVQKADRETEQSVTPSIPRALCPLNIVSYSGMPAAFWTCFESRNAVAAYYHNIAVVPKDIRLKHGNLPIGTLETYRPSKFSDFYSIDKQILQFESIREEMFSFPLQPSVPFNPDLDIFNFNHLDFDPYADWEHPAEALLLRSNVPLAAGWRPWRYADQVMLNYVIHPWAVKRAQITPDSRFWSHMEHDFSKDPIMQMDSVIFVDFLFQDLDEFIVRDFDCMLYHKFDLPINRDNWRSYLLSMFRVDASHDEFAAVRAGSKFKIPKVTILPGAKISTRCKRCIWEQMEAREDFENRKRLRNRRKRFTLKMLELYGKDQDLWVYPRRNRRRHR
ncbi:hypothetical protein BPOR_0064g00040 [Botrytis porri]|uniref:Uncharacterized protein n=1 Tax=Botrytis porri TaxID=87229 RepID=A0A4Z1L120_9HELO|nr:hypothetical protein BPOR_0064g00040 [Botrytis porri]